MYRDFLPIFLINCVKYISFTTTTTTTTITTINQSRSCEDLDVPARGKITVPTDLQVQLPEDCYGRIAPRSGLAANNHIDIGAGVVDADYRYH